MGGLHFGAAGSKLAFLWRRKEIANEMPDGEHPGGLVKTTSGEPIHRSDATLLEHCTLAATDGRRCRRQNGTKNGLWDFHSGVDSVDLALDLAPLDILCSMHLAWLYCDSHAGDNAESGYRNAFGHGGWAETLEEWLDPARLKDDYSPPGRSRGMSSD